MAATRIFNWLSFFLCSSLVSLCYLKEGFAFDGSRKTIDQSHHLPDTHTVPSSSSSPSSKGVCTERDISIVQKRVPTSAGIQQYTVEIVNTCPSQCSPSDIHLYCGNWFPSAGIINPGAFKRLSYDDCLVNGGKTLKPGQSVVFTYANPFMYPLAFMSANSC